jgi:hypothetical protein
MATETKTEEENVKIRYCVQLQTLRGIWYELLVRKSELGAKKEMAEWKEWIGNTRKTWKDIRIVKETTIREVVNPL